MTLAAIAQLVDAEPKWVLNAMAALGRKHRYSLALARRLAVARAIQRATGGPLALCFAQAQRVLRSHGGGGTAPVVLPTDAPEIELSVDVYRIVSSFDIRLSALNTMHAPQKRGRPSTRHRDPLQVAAAWGTDLTLLSDNLKKTVEERIRQLDSMAAFARGVHRLPSSAG